MSQSRKHRGFRTERVVADYLRRWWEGAVVGRGSGRDILNVPFDCEVKARTGLDVVGTLRQIEARTDESGLLGFACFRLNGQGEKARGICSNATPWRSGGVTTSCWIREAHRCSSRVANPPVQSMWRMDNK
jgi:hypothetical protein